MGWIGGFGILALYLFLLYRAGIIVRKCSRTFPAFLVIGLTLSIVFQALTNMAVSVNLIPVTGQPLPLVSMGGTSLIFTSAAFGMILSISNWANEEEKRLNEAEIKIIVSGGGTGGHIYPAISIANALKQKHSDCEILFVGAEGKMEMEKVPAAGYKIVGLPIRGLQRNFSKENLKFFSRLMRSLKLAKSVIKDFQPDAVVGVGGYASGPLLHMAAKLGVPALIQEQNSYAGITNKLLAKKARKICVAYEGMERFFHRIKL